MSRMKIIGIRQDRFGCAHYRGVGPIMAMAGIGADAAWLSSIPTGTTHVLTGPVNQEAVLDRLLEGRREMGFKLVVDFDEYVGPMSELPPWALPNSDYHMGSERGRMRLRHLEAADAVIFSTQILKDKMAVDKPSVVLPLFVPQHIQILAGSRVAKAGARPVLYLNIGEWRQHDMEPIADVIVKAGETMDLVVSGFRPEWLSSLNGRVTHLPHTEFDSYWANVRRFAPDIVLSPLHDNLHNRCKGATRYIEATLFGAAGAYQKFEPYQDVVAGSTGLICESKQDWADALLELANPRVRNAIISDAKKDLDKRLNWRKAGKEWLEFLKTV